jgi:hypothetical protein
VRLLGTCADSLHFVTLIFFIFKEKKYGNVGLDFLFILVCEIVKFNACYFLGAIRVLSALEALDYSISQVIICSDRFFGYDLFFINNLPVVTYIHLY